MKKETLTCNTCGKNWKRIPLRGRKPHQCPKCVKTSQQTQNTTVKVQQIKPRKIAATQVATVQASASNASPDKDEISVGEIYQYYHPADEKLKEETKGGSKWQCRCGYILEIKFSLSAVPTHRCSDNSKSVQMKRIDK
jgi:rubrerythrin